MREGGIRRFALPRLDPTHTHSITALVANQGRTVVQISHDWATLLSVTLVRVCSPRFCSSNSYQLPGASVPSAKEVACR